MIGAKTFRHRAGVTSFVELRMTETNGKGFYWSGTAPCHQRHYNGGIYPTTKQGAEGNVADQAHPYCFGKAFLHLFKTSLVRSRVVGSVGWYLPVLSQ